MTMHCREAPPTRCGTQSSPILQLSRFPANVWEFEDSCQGVLWRKERSIGAAVIVEDYSCLNQCRLREVSSVSLSSFETYEYDDVFSDVVPALHTTPTALVATDLGSALLVPLDTRCLEDVQAVRVPLDNNSVTGRYVIATSPNPLVAAVGGADARVRLVDFRHDEENTVVLWSPHGVDEPVRALAGLHGQGLASSTADDLLIDDDCVEKGSEYLIAAATHATVVLLDVRRPGVPLLEWHTPNDPFTADLSEYSDDSDDSDDPDDLNGSYYPDDLDDADELVDPDEIDPREAMQLPQPPDAMVLLPSVVAGNDCARHGLVVAFATPVPHDAIASAAETMVYPFTWMPLAAPTTPFAHLPRNIDATSAGTVSASPPWPPLPVSGTDVRASGMPRGYECLDAHGEFTFAPLVRGSNLPVYAPRVLLGVDVCQSTPSTLVTTTAWVGLGETRTCSIASHVIDISGAPTNREASTDSALLREGKGRSSRPRQADKARPCTGRSRPFDFYLQDG